MPAITVLGGGLLGALVYRLNKALDRRIDKRDAKERAELSFRQAIATKLLDTAQRGRDRLIQKLQVAHAEATDWWHAEKCSADELQEKIDKKFPAFLPPEFDVVNDLADVVADEEITDAAKALWISMPRLMAVDRHVEVQVECEWVEMEQAYRALETAVHGLLKQ
jgi:hypothetical protein